MGQAPAFSVVRERALRGKAEAVINESLVRGPGQLDESAPPLGEAFSEKIRRQIALLKNVSRVQVDHAQGRPSIESGAFVEMAVNVDQSLSERFGIVRVGVKDLKGIGARRGWRRCQCEGSDSTKKG